MPNIDPFDRYSEQYELWFERYPYVYQAELRALARLIEPGDEGLEIGVGTGRFAVALGIHAGLEPSVPMALIARQRGIDVAEGVAEILPYPDNHFGFSLMMATICFVDDPLTAFREAYRVIREGGYLVVGFVDAESPLGRSYLASSQKSRFYQKARFFSTQVIVDLLADAGFGKTTIVQTLFRGLAEIGPEEPVREGYGEGGFVAVRADKGRTLSG